MNDDHKAFDAQFQRWRDDLDIPADFRWPSDEPLPVPRHIEGLFDGVDLVAFLCFEAFGAARRFQPLPDSKTLGNCQEADKRKTEWKAVRKLKERIEKALKQDGGASGPRWSRKVGALIDGMNAYVEVEGKIYDHSLSIDWRAKAVCEFVARWHFSAMGEAPRHCVQGDDPEPRTAFDQVVSDAFSALGYLPQAWRRHAADTAKKWRYDPEWLSNNRS